MESTADKISLRNDEDITELIKMLKDFKDNAGLEKITEAVNYVEGIENVLNGIGQRLDRLQHELDSVKEQNDHIMSRTDRTMKDSLKEQVQKSRDRLNDMWKKVIEVMNAIKLKAHEIVESVRHNGRRALKKTADILHIRKGLERVRFRADKMIAGLAGLEDKINDYKEQRGQAASERSAPMMEKETDKDMDNGAAISHVEDDRDDYGGITGTYQHEIKRFVDNCVAEGIEYGSNAEAYEAFKDYYSKSLKADSQAGRINMVSRADMDNKKR